MIHSITADCVPLEADGIAYHLPPHFMPCSRQPSATEQPLNVAIIETPSWLHKRRMGEAAGTHLVTIFKRSLRFDILKKKCNLSCAAFSG